MEYLQVSDKGNSPRTWRRKQDMVSKYLWTADKGATFGLYLEQGLTTSLRKETNILCNVRSGSCRVL
jgi:hypothetical protein